MGSSQIAMFSRQIDYRCNAANITGASCTTTKKRVGIFGDSPNLLEKTGALTAEAEESPLKIK